MKIKTVLFRFCAAVCALGAAGCTAFILAGFAAGEDTDLCAVVTTGDKLFILLAIMMAVTAAGLMAIPFFLIAGCNNRKFRKAGKICSSMTAGLAIAVAVTAIIPLCFFEISSIADYRVRPELFTSEKEIPDDADTVYSSSIRVKCSYKKIKVQNTEDSTDTVTSVTASFWAHNKIKAELTDIRCTVKDADGNYIGTVSIPVTETLSDNFRLGTTFSTRMYIPITGGHYYSFDFYWVATDGTPGRASIEINE